jgi:hypothetical protein
MNDGQVKYFFQKIFFDLIRENLPFPEQYAIAGGAVRAAFIGEKLNDIDVFCSNSEAADRLIELFKVKGATLKSNNDRLHNFVYENRWFQVIKSAYHEFNDSTELIDKFDFTVCQAMVYLPLINESLEGSSRVGKQPRLRVGPYFYQDCLSKHLRINHILFPLNTLHRLQKYAKKGYKACNQTLVEVARSLQTVNLLPINSESNDAATSMALFTSFYGMD